MSHSKQKTTHRQPRKKQKTVRGVLKELETVLDVSKMPKSETSHRNSKNGNDSSTILKTAMTHQKFQNRKCVIQNKK